MARHEMLLFVLLATSAVAIDIQHPDTRLMQTYSVSVDAHGTPRVTAGKGSGRDVAATAVFGTGSRVDLEGWNYLHLSTNSSFPDASQAYLAGFLEGVITADLIHPFWRNTVQGLCSGQEKFCNRLRNYFDVNERWVKKNVEAYGDSDPYWHQVRLFYGQMLGVADGFFSVNKNSTMTYEDFLWMNINGDMGDFMSAFGGSGQRNMMGSGSCSGFIRVVANDLYVAHDTWGSYGGMIRILKRYDLNYHLTNYQGAPLVPGKSISMSSYPGILSSVDDYYITAAQLAVLETTIDNYNQSLWRFVRPTNSLITGVRTMIANRLSRTGAEWTSIFAKYNSGTYNNQWMVVDYKLFGGSILLRPGLLWVLEQLPGMTHAEDVTSVLFMQSYWPSYNCPYFDVIFDASNAASMVRKYGDWFTYSRTPRALIFLRDHVKATSLDSTLRLMRQNDYLHDPLSRCNCTPSHNAENAIASRSDLNPAKGTYPFPSLGHRSHGATDSKLTNGDLVRRLAFVAVAGPTHDPLPPFQWSKSDFAATTPHYGQPDLFKFLPILVTWE